MSIAIHERREDTGFTSAQLGLYLFLAADAMFHGALYSSYALLRTSSDRWEPGNGALIAALGSAALAALVVASIAGRFSARPHRVLLGALLLSTLLHLALTIGLGYAGAAPRVNVYFALVHLFNGISLLHALGGAAYAGVLTLKDTPPLAPEAAARARLTGIFAGASALFWGLGLGLCLCW